MNRLGTIFRTHPLGQVELLLAAEGLAFVSWFALGPASCSRVEFRAHLAGFWPALVTTWAMVSIGLVFGGLQLTRLAAVIGNWVTARRMLAAVNAFVWLTVFLGYIWSGVTSSEMPFYLVSFAANFWIFVRLDERNIRSRG